MTADEHRLAAAVTPADVKAIMAAIIKKAQGGDVGAAKFCMDRADHDAKLADWESSEFNELLNGKK